MAMKCSSSAEKSNFIDNYVSAWNEWENYVRNEIFSKTYNKFQENAHNAQIIDGLLSTVWKPQHKTAFSTSSQAQ